MKIIEKKVYYCDWCKFKKLSSWAVKKHELRCTLNPRRICGNCDIVQPIPELIVEYFPARRFDSERLEDARDKLCPACILAVLRQAGFHAAETKFDYKEEMQAFWEKEKEDNFYNDNIVY